MVHVTAEDFQAGDDLGLLEFLSSDSDSDLEAQQSDPEIRQLFSEIEPEVPFSARFPNVLIIAGLPCVPEDKVEKLTSAITKRILQELTAQGVLTINEETKLLPDGSPSFTINIPKVTENDGTIMTAGVCFVTFKDAFVATKAAGYLKKTGLDKKNPFHVCTVDELDTVIGESLEAAVPAEVGFSRASFWDWLCDPLGREQYAYRCGTKTDIVWHDAIVRVPKSACSEQEEMLGTAVCWSPMGSYLITFHKRGIWLRANKPFQKMVCFTYPGVKYTLFSPNEEYLITWDGTNSNVSNDQAVIVWHVFSGKKLRTFSTPQYSTNGVRVDEGGQWPFFLFSPDSKYLAVRREKDIVIYETATMLILEDPSELAQGKRERTPLSYPAEQFQWSPTANLLSIWISEFNDAPGRLLLVEIPSRQEVSSKNVFSVKNVSMHWHPRGEFLALRTVIARKKGKKTKKETTQIEVFRVKDKSIPVDTINIEDARVKSLHWELGQNACRFATLSVNELTSSRFINFYNVPVKGAKQDTELVETLPVPHGINCFEWSPAGQYFLAASKGSDGCLIFGCLNELNRAEVIQKDEHFELTDIFWDPSGRYVTTAVLIPFGMTSFRITCNAGFRIYSFLGRLLYRLQDERCSQFLWRPRPVSLLPAAKIEDLHKKLKEYSKKYDAQDELRRQARNTALKQETTGKLQRFTERCQAAHNWMVTHPRAAEWEKASKLLKEYMEWYERPTNWEETLEVTREPVKKAD